jgi:hypothetical protein
VITALTKVNDALEKNPPDQKVWTTYRDDAQIPSQRVFAEYVDFLGGLALRDTGFDRGISQIAEELIRTYNTYKPKSAQQPAPMALPIRQEAVAKTLARIVRVGFPEWTVWALPFTAYEFWHAIAREDVDDPLRQELEKRKVLKPEEPIPSRFQTILGDAFATFTMGPAYPCSALYLLLNPLMAYAADPRSTRASRRSPRPDESPVRDDTRLCAMLEMLRLIGKQEETEGDEPPDVVLAQKFTETWSSAIQSAGVGAVTKQTQTDNEVAKTMVGALYTVLGKSHCEAVRISEWGKLPGLDHVLIDHPLAVGELRRVLNAIWKWRVSPSGTHDDEEIAEKVRMRILNKESGQTAAQSRHFGNVAPPRGVAAP